MLRALLAILALHRLALGIAAALIVVYALVGFFWVPHLLRTNAQRYVADELDRTLTLGKVSFNPFTFRLDVRDAALAEKTGDAIASFTGLIVNAELASIWQRAIVLKEVQLDAPDVNLVVERDGSINLAHLVPDEAEPPPAADAAAAPLPRIRIGRLAVNDGRVDFEDADRARPAPFTATLSPIRFALEDFRTDLNHENAYQFAARSGAGETLEWSGSFTAQPLGSHGRFAVGQLGARTIDSYLQGKLPVRLVGGALSLTGTYRLALHPTLTFDVGLPEMTFENFAVAEQAESPPIAVVPKIHLAGTQFSFGTRAVRVDNVTIDGARVRASREADGSLSVARLAKGETTNEAPASPAPAPPSTATWHWAVGEIRVADAALDLEDRTLSPAVQLNLAPMALTVAGLSGEPGTKINVTADVGLGGNPLLKSSGAAATHTAHCRTRPRSERIRPVDPAAVYRAGDELDPAIGTIEPQGRFVGRSGGGRDPDPAVQRRRAGRRSAQHRRFGERGPRQVAQPRGDRHRSCRTIPTASPSSASSRASPTRV